MNPSPRRSFFQSALLLGLWLLQTSLANAEPVAVRHAEGLVHGFLALKTLEGKGIAGGDLLQSVQGSDVTTQLIFHFKDSSVHDETVIFSQQGNFRLLSYHLIQKGPTFPVPMEVVLDGTTGRMNVRYTEGGKDKSASERFDVTPDLANGLMPVLLKNFPHDARSMTVSMAAETPKPRMVKLVITPYGEDSFFVANSMRKAMNYRVKVDIGGVTGLLAHLVGKQPPDIHVWILGGETPAFVRMEGPLFLGGPVWRIELASPVWR
jgi:hypothetical protein